MQDGELQDARCDSWRDAGWRDAGWRDAGWRDAGWRDGCVCAFFVILERNEERVQPKNLLPARQRKFGLLQP